MESSSSIRDRFARAEEFVKSLPPASAKTARIVTDAVRLELYGLYKVAKVGRCDTPRPGGMFNFTEKAKWDAWFAASQRQLSEEAAMLEYCKRVDTLRGV